jgi:hypothetical protein
LKKDFIVLKIEASQDGSPYVFVTFTDPTSADRQQQQLKGPFGAFTFNSPEDMMKNLPKVLSKAMGAGGGGLSDSPTLKLSMREYQDMGFKVGDKVIIEIKKLDSGGV